MKKRAIAVLCTGIVLLQLTGCSGFKSFFMLNADTTLEVSTSETEKTPVGAPDLSPKENDSQTTSSGESSSAATTRESASAPTTESETTSVVRPETTTAQTATTAADPSVPQPSTAGNATGLTSRGYTIREVDGITYVDGVMIVNKTYSIPSSYSPGDLTDECRAAFRELQDAAASEAGLSMYVVSGYRSYSTQDGLYNRYVARDGQAEADTYSARPGHSEHQTGLAIDVNSVTYAFADTAEGQWLAANAHRFGFIIRYPKGKQEITGYAYEPWHIRFVGKALAPLVYDSGLCLEEYFGITSVYA